MKMDLGLFVSGADGALNAKARRVAGLLSSTVFIIAGSRDPLGIFISFGLW
jgi:hypothetical protein